MSRNPHLPLTETTFYILLVLTTPAHGYAIIQEIEKLSNGFVKVAAGTMYGAIENLLKLNWIEEIPSRPLCDDEVFVFRSCFLFD